MTRSAASRSPLDLFRLDGKRALVTGAGSGLGRVFARTLAGAGAEVVCTDINAADCAETAESIRANGGTAQAKTLDVSDARAVSEVVIAAGDLDVLVNNAGIASAARQLHELSIEDWDRVQQVNVRGVFLCMRAALPRMLLRDRGSIVNLASVAALGGTDNAISAVAANYSASKGAVIALSRQAAVEYASRGIRCNVIAPGWHLGTNLGRDALPDDPARLEEIVATLRRSTPMGRTGDPEELAGLVLYLASDASSFVTGQVVAHDGGWTAW